MSGQIARTPLLSELAGILGAPVDSALRERAAQHLLDWVGCAVAVRSAPVAKALSATSDGGVLGRAFFWGGLGNVLEMDDVDKRALLHPGPSIVPAALALAMAVDAKPADLLEALVVGYEATIRMGRAVGGGHYSLWHNTGTCGPIGAAAACARILHLDTDQAAHAMALAVSQSAGLWQTRHEPDSMGKQLHTAHAARAGLHAAQLAAAGMRGPLTILEGEQGFFAAMCPDGSPDSIVREQCIGVIKEVSFKPWPACRHAHPAIDAAIILNRQGCDSDEDICVSTYADALKFCDRPEPRSVIEAKFSIQHAVAVTLLRGKPQLSDFDPSAIEDPAVAALRKRVRVGVDPDLDAAYPARFGASLSVDGQTISVPDALGDPENPLSTGELAEKARVLMKSGGVLPQVADPLIENIIEFNETSSFASLGAGLREVLP